MGLLDCASGASVWRGYDYYREQKVIRIEEMEPGIFTARVSGSSDDAYAVELHMKHPRKSKCNCPHADGKRIICKHIVASYFTVLPNEAEKFYAEAMAYQEEEERRAEEIYERVQKYVCKMKKNELQSELLAMLSDGPDWQFDRFVEEHGLDD